MRITCLETGDHLASASTCLSMQRVNESTLATYRKAVDNFLEFCNTRRLSVRSRMQLDDHLADFGNSLYESSSRRGQRQLFINAVMGVELLNPHLKEHLLRSRAVYAGWDKVALGASSPPIPIALLAVIVLRLRRTGHRPAALGIFLAFHALLRIQELVRLRWDDVLLPGDCRLPHFSRRKRSGGILIRVAKTGVLQFVPVFNEKLLSILSASKASFPPEDKVVGSTSSNLRRLFEESLEHAGCASLGYVFHSLRHGGATNMYLHGYDIATIQATGRWKQTKTCSVYVQAGRGLLLGTHFSTACARGWGLRKRSWVEHAYEIVAADPTASSREVLGRVSSGDSLKNWCDLLSFIEMTLFFLLHVECKDCLREHQSGHLAS